MIQTFVDRFMSAEAQAELRAGFAAEHPSAYIDIVKAVVRVLADDDYDSPDPDRIHAIDDGHYQGTLVFVIAAKDYQPSNYWYAMVRYGSCSGCDTLKAIRAYSDDPPTPSEVDQYMTLALHLVQGLKLMGDPED